MSGRRKGSSIRGTRFAKFGKAVCIENRASLAVLGSPDSICGKVSDNDCRKLGPAISRDTCLHSWIPLIRPTKPAFAARTPYVLDASCRYCLNPSSSVTVAAPVLKLGTSSIVGKHHPAATNNPEWGE